MSEHDLWPGTIWERHSYRNKGQRVVIRDVSPDHVFFTWLSTGKKDYRGSKWFLSAFYLWANVPYDDA